MMMRMTKMIEMKTTTTTKMMMINMKRAAFLFIFTLLICQLNKSLAKNTCISSMRNPLQINYELKSDYNLGALLNIHEYGNRGLFDCGNVTRTGIVIYEALEWAIGVLNQDAGLINGVLVKDTFIPGIKIGVKIFDTCFHQDISISNLAKLYPILYNGYATCASPNGNANKDGGGGGVGANRSQLDILGVLDMTGISTLNKVNEFAHQYYIPVINILDNAMSSAELIGHVLNQMLFDLDWKQIAIVHDTDESSIHIVKMLGQIAAHDKLCLKLVEQLPATVATDVDPLRAYKSLFNLITSELQDNLPILVIGSSVKVENFIRLISSNVNYSNKFQWIFTTMPYPDIIKMLPRKLLNKIFTLTPFPPSVAVFEHFWRQLQKPNTELIDNLWFREYIEMVKECKGKECINVPSPETSIDTLWRTMTALPVINTVFTIAHALRNAWDILCEGKRGNCMRLSQLSRSEFLSNYLEPLQFEHEISSRSPPELFGMKTDTSKSSYMSGVRLALTKFVLQKDETLSYTQLIIYDSSSNEGKVINNNIAYRSSPCGTNGCKTCVKIRQSREKDIFRDEKVIDYGLRRNDLGANLISMEYESNTNLTCMKKCSKCLEQFKSEQLVDIRPKIVSNFRQTWGLIVSVLSGFGVLLVFVCGLYFLLTFPINSGTTILGYFILIGLLALYSINFFFLFPVTYTICCIRRLGMSIAYSLILSGMLVKVMNTWRMLAYKNANMSEIRLVSACGLLFVSGGLVVLQVAISLIWLFIYPPSPTYGTIAMCSSNVSNTLVETESIVGLVYLMILLVITVFFATLTWKCYDNNREPRYIMLCCICIAFTWTLWSLIYWALIGEARVQREMGIVVVNLINATLIIVCLHLRNLYIYRKLSRKIQCEHHLKSRLHTTAFPAVSLYGTVHKTNPIIWDNEKSLYQKATRKPFDADNMDDGTSSCGGSTTGSVQVQAQDLYPMEVYDGGSAQPGIPQAIYNANSNRSLYMLDETTFIR